MFSKYRVACESIFLAAVFFINIFFWMLRTTIQSELVLFMVVEIWKSCCKFEFSFPSCILTQVLPVLHLISVGSCPSIAISSLLAAKLLNIPTANRWEPGTLSFFWQVLLYELVAMSLNCYRSILQTLSICLKLSLLSICLPFFVWDLLQRTTFICAVKLVRCHYRIILTMWGLAVFILLHMHKAAVQWKYSESLRNLSKICSHLVNL